MPTATAGYVVHCRPCEWLSTDQPTPQAADDLAGTHDDTLHPGHRPIATVIALPAGVLRLPIPHTGQPLAVAA
ncbi:hypothetical protein [Cryptosporangium aurantiacum]|uniref:Uncharacterized protein n=1 Tax=Cryptosporangium aurantiacum TaxID=134849 RepID=A0A1M7RJX6_9ACTN|nr:hypothetical protein [Cryptosporangium aurantiacum]SHN46446.1 hypothetical protein SAMN05443668_115135 [Cryptosporangium aurantiacum]